MTRLDGQTDMAKVDERLEKELEQVADPSERQAVGARFEQAHPLMQEISYAVITGDHQGVDRLTSQALAEGFPATTILDDGLVAGMAVVGIKFRDNVIFVPEVLVAARAMKAGMAHLESILSASGIRPKGVVVTGTVKGDLHDIGKNLCVMMLRGAGFTVHDLGVDIRPEEFIDAVAEHGAQVLGLSALLTTTMPNMGKTIEALEEAGLRGTVKIMVGGAPLSQEFADDMGADGYGKDAMACVDLAGKLSAGDQAPENVPAITPEEAQG
jgi:5-methyltetrahydrofolate--homocysteine methyltransferase